MIEWRRPARGLADRLRRDGWITDERWWRAFAETPRHLFVPRYFHNDPNAGWQAVSITDDDGLCPVYTDEALVTQLDGDPDSWHTARRDGVYYGGVATSSSSSPALMATMAEAVDIHDGHRVLEIGTGTGYNAAILCHRLGDTAITSVDVDPLLVDHATARLADLGYRPLLTAMDALTGCPAGPFDRIMCTVAVPGIPPVWITQVHPGGLILANLGSDLFTDALFGLRVADSGTAEGRAVAGGTFMHTRSHTMPLALDFHEEIDAAAGEDVATGFDAARLDDFGAFYLFLSLHLRDVQRFTITTDNGRTQRWLLGRDGSWAYQTSGEPHRATQGGPRRIWTETENLLATWETLDNPGRDRIGLTVTPDGQHRLWIDRPDSGHTWTP